MALLEEENEDDDENWLSDKTLVQDCPWSILKTFAMKPNYGASARFVSKINKLLTLLIQNAFTDKEKDTVKQLIEAQYAQGNLLELLPVEKKEFIRAGVSEIKEESWSEIRES